MTVKTKIRPPKIIYPADMTPICPPHYWKVEKDGKAVCKKCLAITQFETWLSAFEQPREQIRFDIDMAKILKKEKEGKKHAESSFTGLRLSDTI